MALRHRGDADEETNLTMDQNALRNLARLKLVARKQFGMDVDVQRMVSDNGYARDMLDRIEQSDDEDTLVLALSMRNDLGLLVSAASEPPPAAVPAAAVREPAAQRKYIGGVRG